MHPLGWLTVGEFSGSCTCLDTDTKYCPVVLSQQAVILADYITVPRVNNLDFRVFLMLASRMEVCQWLCLLGMFPLVEEKENRNKPDSSLERSRLCLDFIVKLHSFLPPSISWDLTLAYPNIAQILIISNVDIEPEASTNPNSLESPWYLSNGGTTHAHRANHSIPCFWTYPFDCLVQ